ncbi:hypothetical protein C0995_010586 [Termitomyces sp. Mi166|nr:hypothetical protein C0995_010586 [Termitomyces sp. Mi166\
MPISPMATTVIHVTRDALEIAGSIVPFVGAAAVVVREISDRCDEIRVHKVIPIVPCALVSHSTIVIQRKARRMAKKCLQLQNILDEQNPDQVGEEMLRKIDEAYGAGLLMHRDQREATELQRRDLHDIKDLLIQVLANKGGELAQVNELEENTRVAEAIMHEGQQLLHQEPMVHGLLLVYFVYVDMGMDRLLQGRAVVRQNSEADQLMFADIRTGSPPPLPSDSQRYLEHQREVVQRGLIQLHELTGIPPSIKLMNGEVKRVGDLAVAGGTYSDIWQGLWLGQKKVERVLSSILKIGCSRGITQVALKALRNIKATDSKAQKRFEQEINIWASLQHEHILPFYGIVTDQGQHIQMASDRDVSPWQDFGNVLEYVKCVPKANRIHLLSGAAKGLEYLHNRNIIHGNVKCANILVSEEEEACICDFGMSKVIEDVTEKSASATLTASGSARWLAPELIEGIVTSPTKEADTYSYAMAMLELVTGKHPFSNRRRDASVIHDIVVLKKIPIRPTESEVLPWLTDNLWALMTDCWKVPASSRPSMEQVSARIGEIDAGTDKAKLTPILESDSDAMDTS